MVEDLTADLAAGTRGRSGDELARARGLATAVRRGHVPVVMLRVP